MVDSAAVAQPLAFEAQPITALAARYQKALEGVFTQARVQAGERPGLIRAHVFDFENGLRLIISRDETYKGPEGHLHVSASVEDRDDCTAAIAIRHMIAHAGIAAGKRTLQELAMAAFATIAGRPMPLFLGWTHDKGVPHWLDR